MITARNSILLMSATCALALAAPARAQAVPSSAGTVAAGNDTATDGNSGDIVVTAQKRSERLLDVPVPVSVVSAADLLRDSSYTLGDYFTKLPGLSVIQRGNGRSTVVVRGITTGSGNSPTVGITLDDVPLGSSTGGGLGDAVLPEIDPADVQQVEVLRGPQGTLYGASSLGGLIKYVSIQPDTEKFGGDVSATGNSVDHGGLGYGGHAAVNVPIIQDTLALRVSGFYHHDAGFIDDPDHDRTDLNRSRTYGGKASLLWDVTPNISVLGTALLQNYRSDGSASVYVDANRTPIQGDYDQDALPGVNTGDKKMRIYSLKVADDFGFATLSSITSYSHVTYIAPQDVSGTFGHYLPFFFDDTTGLGVGIINNYLSKKWTQELRLASNGSGRLEWQVGGFYTHEDNDNYQDIYVADFATGQNIGFPDLYKLYGPTTYREFAGYGDLTYHVTDKFQLQVGGRYSTNKQTSLQTVSGILEGETDVSSARSKDHAFTFLVTPSYHITNDMMVYGRVATGYRPGGPNLVPNGSANATFGPDRTTNYEIGFKGNVIDRVLTLDLSVFDIEWKKIQLLETDAASGFSFTGNAGHARSRGVEATANLTPWKGMTVVGNFAYTDAQLRQNIDVSSLYAQKGDMLPYAAKYAGSVDVEQRFPLPDGVEGHVGGNVAYVGNRKSDFARAAGQPRFDMPAYTTIELRAGIDYAGWDYSIFARNLTDKRGFIAGGANDTITRTGVFSASIIQPRTIGLTLSKKF